MTLKELLQSSDETEKSLAKAIFCTTETTEGDVQLTFLPALQQIYEECDYKLHSPLQQISSFMKWGSLIPPPEREIINSWKGKQAIPDLSTNGVVVYPQLQGSPEDIFLALSGESKEIQRKIDDKISRAKQVMLFGAISVPSVVETATWLKTKGFKGKLSVFDISPIPVEIGRIYKKFRLLPQGFNIEFFQSDVLSLPSDTAKADLIISDVLGYYLTPEQYIKLMISVESTLTTDGIWLTRELIEPQGAPKPEDRTVSKLPPDKIIDGLNEFIERIFKVRLPKRVIQDFINTRWVMVKTYPRCSEKDYFQALPETLKIINSIRISSEALIKADQQRIFEICIIQKQ